MQERLFNNGMIWGDAMEYDGLLTCDCCNQDIIKTYNADGTLRGLRHAHNGKYCDMKSYSDYIPKSERNHRPTQKPHEHHVQSDNPHKYSADSRTPKQVANSIVKKIVRRYNHEVI